MSAWQEHKEGEIQHSLQEMESTIQYVLIQSARTAAKVRDNFKLLPFSVKKIT